MTILPLLFATSTMASPIRPDALRATVERLASFPTRNTNTPELTQAAEWIAGEFRRIPGMQVELMRYPIQKGSRVPEDKEVVQVVATLPPSEPEQGGAIVVGGHFDTINMTPGADPMTARAPGANDDASGVAVTLEVARAMASRPRTHKMVFVAFSGEEQGLLGSAALAKRAKTEGWKIDAVLSHDMVGNSHNKSGQSDTRHVRVFSEESPDHNSRELARWIEWHNRTEGPKGFSPKLVFRADRFGRGGDHTPFNREGFTAVRVVEMHEEYSRQHTPDDLPKDMDFDYAAHVADMTLNAVATLATASAPPAQVRADRTQSHDAKISWRATPGTSYMVYWRETTEPTWTHWKAVGATSEFIAPKTSKDDNVFAVGAVGGIPIEAK